MQKFEPKGINNTCAAHTREGIEGRYVQFIQDCQNWLDYSLNAYGDLYVYRSGIEALFHRHHMYIKEIYDDDIVLEITKKMGSTIALDFTNEAVIHRFENEENQGFSQTARKDPYQKKEVN